MLVAGLAPLILLASGPFPLPAIDGKAVAVTSQQKHFRLPIRFDRVRAFYETHFSGEEGVGIAQRISGPAGQRVLTLISKRPGEWWAKALVREKNFETLVEVVPILRADATSIEGNAKPLVQFIIGRSPEVKRAIDSLESKHLDDVRGP
jgi:hypothetical protein